MKRSVQPCVYLIVISLTLMALGPAALGAAPDMLEGQTGIRGKLVDSSGLPVNDVNILVAVGVDDGLGGMNVRGYGYPDQNGIFEIALYDAGEYYIEIQTQNTIYLAQFYYEASSLLEAEKIRVVFGQMTQIEKPIVLKSYSSIKGTVSSTCQAYPLDVGMIAIYRPNGDAIGISPREIRAQDGTYLALVPPGDYIIYAEVNGHKPQYYDGIATNGPEDQSGIAQAKVIKVGEEGTVSGIDFLLECSDVIEDFQILNISPDSGENDQPTMVSVIGRKFAEGITLRLQNPAESLRIDISDVTYIGGSRIDAVIPAGLALGEYDVVITNPDLTERTLVKGFTVIEPVVATTEASSGAETNSSAITSGEMSSTGGTTDDTGGGEHSATSHGTGGGGGGDNGSCGCSATAETSNLTASRGIIPIHFGLFWLFLMGLVGYYRRS